MQGVMLGIQVVRFEVRVVMPVAESGVSSCPVGLGFWVAGFVQLAWGFGLPCFVQLDLGVVLQGRGCANIDNNWSLSSHK